MTEFLKKIIDYKIIGSKSNKAVYDEIICSISDLQIFNNNSVLLIPTKFNKIEVLDKEYFLFNETSFFFYNFGESNKDNGKDYIRFIIFSHIFRQLRTEKSITESLLETKILNTVTEISLNDNKLSISKSDTDGDNKKVTSIPFGNIIDIDSIDSIYKTNYTNVWDVLSKKITIKNAGKSMDEFSLEGINSFSQIEELFLKKNICFKELITKIRERKNPNKVNDSISSINNDEFFDKLINLFLLAKFSNFKYFYYISSITTDIESFNESFGTFVLSAKNKFNKRTLQDVKQLNHFIWSFISIVELDNQIKITRNHAIKSAIAAIMSRNMSHNLGSHVLSYASVNLNHPFDVQVLMEYMQERMDFIAQIAAEQPQWSMPIHFVSQLMRNFYKQRILLNYISKSEGLSAKEYNLDNDDENKLQIKVLSNDGEELVPNGNEESSSNKDPIVAILGGITGAHAFYTILENVIRNAAKHSYSKGDADGLIIYVQINDSNEESVSVKIFDNVTKNIETDKRDENDVAISLFTDIENKIKQSLIKKNGSLRYENWGLAEIKIGTGFLQKKGQNVIGGEIEEIDKSFIKLIALKNEKGETDARHCIGSFIGYEFKISKPKYVLIIYKDSCQLPDNVSEYNKNGVYFLKDIEITDDTKFDYEFVLYKNGLSNGIIANLPARSYEYKSFEKKRDDGKFVIKIDKTEIEFNNSNTLREKLFAYRITQLLGEENPQVCLEVSPFGDISRGSMVDNIRAYKYAAELLLSTSKKFEKDQNLQKFIQGVTDFESLVKKYIGDRNKQTEKFIELVGKKQMVVDMFGKYDEKIETLPRFYIDSNKSSNNNNNTTPPESNNVKFYLFDIKNKGIKRNSDCPNSENIINIKYIRHFSNNTNKDYYVEALSGSQSYFSEIENFVKNNDANNIFAYSLMETGLLGITVVDERIFEFYDSNPEIAKRFDAINITVHGKLEDIIINGGQKTKTIDVLIIHQAVYDEYKGKNPKVNASHLFITSGSGDKKEDVVINNEKENRLHPKFISFSNVRSALMRQYPEKYILIQTLMKI